ncbi:hypothetical protein C7S18_00935 [Ahniella affigens]|uniref:Uncharacterized protein n=1 Tax=Ahniella affigens TaxID=2021234 RepID=A0A2P1PLY2_9GAMM|nr:hypothetical protein [Ahniella affigens]AVP95848.1 hypothetical protein C7S18_00935 [Ahniella affigens]
MANRSDRGNALHRLAWLTAASFWPLVASAGTVRVDGIDYSLNTDVAPNWNYSTNVLQLGASSLANCFREGGGLPSTGSWRIDFAGGSTSIFTNSSIHLTTSGPQVTITSVDGDLQCSGVFVPVVFADDFE